MRALPRCAAESSICSINYNSPLPHPHRTLPPVSFQWPHYTWVKSRNPHSVLWLMQSRTTCIPMPPPTALPPPIHPHKDTHSHTHTPPQTIPCEYLDVLSIRWWTWEREQIKALRYLGCVVHAFSFFLAAEWILLLNSFADDRDSQGGTEAHFVAAWFVRSYVRSLLWSLHITAVWIQRLHMLIWDCFHSALWKDGEIVSQIKLYLYTQHATWPLAKMQAELYLLKPGSERKTVYIM